MFAPWKKSYDQPRQHIAKQKHHFDDKGSGPSSQRYVFSNRHVLCESWTINKAKHQIIDALSCAAGEDS